MCDWHETKWIYEIAKDNNVNVRAKKEVPKSSKGIKTHINYESMT